MSAPSCVVCYGFNREKGVPTPCCRRFVCRRCVTRTPRYGTYCVLCQLPIDVGMSASGDVGDADEMLPPAYDAAVRDAPPYSVHHQHDAKHEGREISEKETIHAVQHYVRPDDSVRSLALAYNVDVQSIRQANNIFSDHLLGARPWVMIPGAHRSLSAAPPADEQEKVRLKKFMVQTRCTDYDMARCECNSLCFEYLTDLDAAYMMECDYVLADAIARFNADTAWQNQSSASSSSTGASSMRSRHHPDSRQNTLAGAFARSTR
ncbi:hypothetical protein PYCC9005_002343 [Savitreella phatthalungensis]